MDDLLPPPVARLFKCQSRVVVPALIVIGHAAVGFRRPGDVRHGIGHLAEARFTLIQGRLGPFAFGDVMIKKVEAIGRRVGVDFQPEVAAVRPVVILEVDGDVLLHGPPVLPLNLCAEGGGPLLPVRFSQERLGRLAVDAGRLSVDLDDPPFAVQGDKGVGDTVEDIGRARVGLLGLPPGLPLGVAHGGETRPDEHEDDQRHLIRMVRGEPGVSCGEKKADRGQCGQQQGRQAAAPAADPGAQDEGGEIGNERDTPAEQWIQCKADQRGQSDAEDDERIIPNGPGLDV